jgi:hypothetical protein
MLDYNRLSDELFKIMKGRGMAVEMFTVEGQRTIEPTESRRFFDSKTNTMINIDEDDSELKVHLSQNHEVDENMIKALKTFASKNMLEFTVRTYGKNLEPKDFAHQGAQEKAMQVQEGISKAYGSQKSSYQHCESAKLIIRHSKPVSEEIRGSRSRHIKELFIENSEGERFKLPHTSLVGGRAMARHVSMGGTTLDEVGQQINTLTSRMLALKEFIRYAKTNHLVNESNQELVSRVAKSALGIKETLQGLTSARKYASIVETIKESPVQIDNSKIDELRDQFTVKKFDESLEAILPFIADIKEGFVYDSDYEEIADKVAKEYIAQYGTAEPQLHVIEDMIRNEIDGMDDDYKFDMEHCAGLVLNNIAGAMTGMESIEPDMDAVFDSKFDSAGILFK